MPTGSKKVRAKADAFKETQAKLFKKKERQVKIQFLKKARKRKNAIFEGPHKNSGVDKRKQINKERRSIG
ncbi:hypothetical protein LCGC14_0531420 [marine sediment metagenome]|uniref:Uncharacterized protein n=1 Tax=marine sediment metagenome TaxID=412755 RepID=A0A0F9UGY0_9ZZZZ